MAKTGPRPKKASAKLTRQVGVMFSPQEYKRLREAAGDVPLSAWIRSQILQVLEAGPALGPQEEKVISKQLNDQFRRLDKMRTEVEALIRKAQASIDER